MFLEIASATFLLADYVYHRWFDDDDAPKTPAANSEFTLPRTELGAGIPLIYGRCRVRTPWLAWAGTPAAIPAADVPTIAGGAQFIYAVNLFFVMGIPIAGGTNRVRSVYVDKLKLQGGDLGLIPGNGNFETPIIVESSTGPLAGDLGYIGAEAEYLNGGATQLLADPTSGAPQTWIAGRMTTDTVPIDGRLIPGFRGYMSLGFFGTSRPWFVGSSPRPGAYSMEVSSYPAAFPLLGFNGFANSALISGQPKIFEECNPMDVVLDLLTGTFGKGGVPLSRIDTVGFAACASTLFVEGLGYSRAIEEVRDARDVIREIEEHVDGVIYEDEASGLVKFKLIRADYNVATMPRIDPSCAELLGTFAFGGRDNLVNKIRVQFQNRAKDYEDDSADAMNQAQAVGQDGYVREVVLRYPGCCTETLAKALARRELSARSRPIAKCRAVVDRSRLRLNPGDAVLVNWPEANVSNMVMRVATVGRGTLSSGKIAVDLIQDVTYLVRGVAFGGSGTIPSFPLQP